MAKQASTLRSKFGYLNYEDIALRIESGDLDAWDVVYCKDQKNIYLLDADCNLIEMRSKVKCYSSVADAIVKINKDKSTYKGELISILSDDKVTYRGYIVNGAKLGEYTVTPLYDHDEKIDYNDLVNQPIKNLENSLESEAYVIKDLEDGFYEIKGWMICPNGDKIYSIVGNTVIIETQNGVRYIKRINTKTINNYVVESNGNVTSAQYITDQYLEQMGYVTDEVVDSKLAAMEVTIMNNVKDYINQTFETLVEHIVDDKLEQSEATQEDIESLFVETQEDEISLLF